MESQILSVLNGLLVSLLNQFYQNKTLQNDLSREQIFWMASICHASYLQPISEWEHNDEQENWNKWTEDTLLLIPGYNLHIGPTLLKNNNKINK